MPTLTKYHPAGEVHAAEVTERNVDDLAEMAGAQTFVAPNGVRYMLVESPAGTTRVEVGGFLVRHGDGKTATYEGMDGDTFAASYAR